MRVPVRKSKHELTAKGNFGKETFFMFENFQTH